MLPPLLLAALIYLQSSIRDLPGPEGLRQADKAAHFIVYAVLGGLTYRAVSRTWPTSSVMVVLCIAAVVAFGALDEYHQLFVPGREASILDLLADTAGACLAILLLARYMPFRHASCRTACRQ